METALEVEKVLEKLPEKEQLKVSQWFEDHRLVVESSAALAEIYDEEDGGGSQLIAE